MTPALALTSSYPPGLAPARRAVAAIFPGGRAVRTVLRALFFTLPLALAWLPATVQAQTIPPCSQPEPTPESLFAAAEAEGLVAVDPETGFTPELVGRLAWVLAMPYLSGDSGGEALATILNLQTRAAANLARLTQTAQSATRILAGDTSVSILRWQEWANGNVTVTCTGAEFSDDAATLAPVTGRYGDVLAEPAGTAIEGATLTRESFVLNHAAIRAEMPDVIPPHRISTVRMSFNPEVLQ